MMNGYKCDKKRREEKRRDSERATNRDPVGRVFIIDGVELVSDGKQLGTELGVGVLEEQLSGKGGTLMVKEDTSCVVLEENRRRVTREEKGKCE